MITYFEIGWFTGRELYNELPFTIYGAGIVQSTSISKKEHNKTWLNFIYFINNNYVTGILHRYLMRFH